MIEIDGKLIAPEMIMIAEIEQRFYANGSAAYLVIQLADKTVIRREHGYGFDAYETMRRIRETRKP